MPNNKKILQAIAEHLGLSTEDLDREAFLQDDMHLGPIELNDLLNFLSSKFDIVFNPEELEDVKTVDDLIMLVEDNMLD